MKPEPCYYCGDNCEPEKHEAAVKQYEQWSERAYGPRGAFREDLPLCAKCGLPWIIHGKQCEPA
jgi:hypothetical protein